MSKEKVKAVLEWPKLMTLRELQSFLGFTGYYHKFIKGYGEIATLLTELTKKSKPFEWTPECQQWFKSLKQRFCKEPILRNHDAEKEIILKTNASDHSVGACMSHQGTDGKLHLIAYYSWKFTPAELNYNVQDKELLVIVQAFQHWRVYLEGAQYLVKVIMDHKNLTNFTTLKILNHQQVRWSEILSAFNFQIQY